MDLKAYVAQRGVQAELARKLGVRDAYLWQMVHGRRPISIERCIAIQQATGGAVTCEELRPDVDWTALRQPAQPTEALIEPARSAV